MSRRSIEIKGLKGLKVDLLRVKAAAEEGTREAVDQVIREAVDEIQAASPVITGRLRASVEPSRKGIRIGAPYAAAVEARRHFIGPVVATLPGRLRRAAEIDIERLLP